MHAQLCPPGNVSDVSKAIECKPCAVNTRKVLGTVCICDKGTFNIRGSNSSEACRPCLAVRQQPKPVLLFARHVGRAYAANTGQSECTSCSPGKTTLRDERPCAEDHLCMLTRQPAREWSLWHWHLLSGRYCSTLCNNSCCFGTLHGAESCWSFWNTRSRFERDSERPPAKLCERHM